MVINEKGLLRAMKEAYRATGYKVAVQNDGEQATVLLAGDGWMVAVQMEHMPRKALGIIAEHLGKIPQPYEAYQVQKDQSQTEIFGMAIQAARDLLDDTVRWKVAKTDLTMGGYYLWQHLGNKRVFRIHPGLEDILSTYGREVQMVGDDTILVAGAVSWGSVNCATDLWEDQEAKLAHLSKYQWVAG